MASGPSSFIDIAVHEEVRARFASGDALILLTTDLENVIWANGPGARLLGFADIEAVMGAPAGLAATARRQIAALPGFPSIGRERSLTVRLASGLASRPVAFAASSVRLRGGHEALLLAVAASPAVAGDPEASAQRAIAGFGADAGYFAAIVDGDGDVPACSPGFERLRISRATLARLVEEVRLERDRLVKRLIPAGERVLPAAIARLTDDPARHLLIAVDEEPAALTSAPDAAEPQDAPAVDVEIAPGADASAKAAAAKDTPVPLAAEHRDDWYFSAPAAGVAADVEDHVFRPDPTSGPVRFVWRTDAEGHFSMVSDEFVRAVGPNAADIVGRRFRDVATVFALDPGGEIAQLLERRDTWSGRTVPWPLEGTNLSVPVDLAALPVYDRERRFEGFRGFGVARMADAVVDPEAIGMALAGRLDVPAEPQPPPQAPGDETIEAPLPATGPDPFEGEVPALAASPHPDRRESDKIIRLAERRLQNLERGLSALERVAFQEIGARLKKDAAAQAPAGAEAAPPASGRTIPEPPGTPEPETPVEPPAAQEPPRPRSLLDLARDAAASTEEAPTPPPLMTSGFVPSAWAVAGEDGERPEGRPDAALLAGLPVPILVHAGDRLYFANREFLSFTGYDSLEALASAGGIDALFADDTPEGIRHEDTLLLRRADGENVPVEAHLQSARWGQGSALLLSLKPREPAEALEAPEPDSRRLDELDARLAEMRTIIDTATDGVVLIAADGTIRSISRPAEALFGLDSAEVEGRPFETLFAMESHRAALDYLGGLADNGVASVLNDGREVIGREAAGRFIPLFMTIGRLPGKGGYCAVLRDITQWKRAEEELTQARSQAERASSQKTDFLARVSHEIRTPLNAIIGFSELMMDEKFGPVGVDRYRDYLRDINRSGNLVLDLVNDLLDISKIEAGEQELSSEAVSLNETLAETVAMMQPQANRERVIIRSSLASRLPDIVADQRSVRQIALNLLSNALRYTPAGGQVIVSTAYEAGGEVVMRVRDTGIGMTLQEIDQALKPFKQINALKRGRGDGTGLGLPLTKAMVEANRARFDISSEPGEGTLVEVTFPSTRVLAQ
jgi:PAS domain S-box-containing protein